jgi:nucleoid DNA-binding protein
MSRHRLIEEVKLQGGAMREGGIAGQAVDAVFEAIGRVTDAGESIQIRGFGTFAVKDRKGRSGRNPRTGERIEIAPRRVLTFSDKRKR